MKTMFVIIANAQWDSSGIGGNSSQQYARTLMRLGYDVAYVEPNGHWKFKDQEAIRDPEHTIVICDFPYFEHTKNLFDHLKNRGCAMVCRIVDHIDSWSTTDVYQSPQFKREYEQEVIRSADCVFALNPLNVQKIRKIRKDVMLLPNGVDVGAFSESSGQKRVSISKGRINLGIVCSFWIPSWIDCAPVLAYAKNHPEDRLHIIGDASSPLANVECPSNVVCHGRKHWSEIAGYIRQFDVGIIPYDAQETMYTNPTKALEYLACAKPVVSPRNASLEGYPYVYFYDHPEEFERAVEDAVTKPIDEEYLENMLNENSWEARIAVIIEAVNAGKTNRKVGVS